MFFDAGRLQQENERSGTSIHDRHFGSRQIDNQVIDPESGQRRHQVFNRCDLDAILDECGAEHRLADQLRIGRNIDRLVEVDATKHDAGIHRRRSQRHINLVARVQSDSGCSYRCFDRALSQHAQMILSS